MQIQLFITGRMYHLAADAPDSLDLPDGASLKDAVVHMQSQLPEPLPDSTLVSVGGRHCGAIGLLEEATLKDGDELMLLVPVAGG